MIKLVWLFSFIILKASFVVVIDKYIPLVVVVVALNDLNVPKIT